MDIIPEYDAEALAAPQAFRDDIQIAINMLDAKFTDNITVKIAVGYGEAGVFGSLPNQNTSEGGYTQSTDVSYSTLRTDLLSTSSFDRDSTSVPNTTSVNGQSFLEISSAQERLWGLLPAVNNTGTVDGQVGFGTGFSTGNVLIDAALHEFAHALGRVAGDDGAFDLFRFTSVGNRLFSDAIPSVAAYFSLDGGNTEWAAYGMNADPGDFLNPPDSNLTPNDPFNETVGTDGHLTGMDVAQMDAIGFGVNIASNDFNGDGQSDLLWSSGGTFTEWQSNGDNTFGLTPNALVISIGSGWSLAGIGDFNGDGTSDLIFQNGGTFTEWQSSPNGYVPNVYTNSVGAGWNLVGVGDFNGDGRSDLIFQNGATFTEWQSTGNSFTPNVYVNSVGAGWTLAGVGDFSGNGESDLIWQKGGTFTEWQSTGNSFTQNVYVNSIGAGWTLAGVGDFNGDGKDDLIFQNGGTFTEWQSTGNGFTPNVVVDTLGAGWSVAAIGDFNGDGLSDILFRNTNGTFTEWQSTGTGFTPNVLIDSAVGTAWTLEYSPTGASRTPGAPAGLTASISTPSAGSSGSGEGGLITTDPTTALLNQESSLVANLSQLFGNRSA